MLSANLIQQIQELKPILPDHFLGKFRGLLNDRYNKDTEAKELLNDLTEPLDTGYHKAIDVSKFPHYKEFFI
jgi:hypothetical protein